MNKAQAEVFFLNSEYCFVLILSLYTTGTTIRVFFLFGKFMKQSFFWAPLWNCDFHLIGTSYQPLCKSTWGYLHNMIHWLKTNIYWLVHFKTKKTPQKLIILFRLQQNKNIVAINHKFYKHPYGSLLNAHVNLYINLNLFFETSISNFDLIFFLKLTSTNLQVLLFI